MCPSICKPNGKSTASQPGSKHKQLQSIYCPFCIVCYCYCCLSLFISSNSLNFNCKETHNQCSSCSSNMSGAAPQNFQSVCLAEKFQSESPPPQLPVTCYLLSCWTKICQTTNLRFEIPTQWRAELCYGQSYLPVVQLRCFFFHDFDQFQTWHHYTSNNIIIIIFNIIIIAGNSINIVDTFIDSSQLQGRGASNSNQTRLLSRTIKYKNQTLNCSVCGGFRHSLVVEFFFKLRFPFANSVTFISIQQPPLSPPLSLASP